MTKIKPLQKTAFWPSFGRTAGKATGAGMLGLTPELLVLLLSAPVLVGGTAGYVHSQIDQPTPTDFDNIGKEMVLSELSKQKVESDRLKRLMEMRKKSASPTQKQDRSIRF